MKSQNIQNHGKHSSGNIQKILRKQVVDLLMRQEWRGNIFVSSISQPNEIKVILRVPHSLGISQQGSKVQLTFCFGNLYPEEPPQLFLTSELLTPEKQHINILSPGEWNSIYSISDIIKNILLQLERTGLRSWLNNIFHSNSINKNHLIYRQNHLQNNNKIKQEAHFQSFLSPFSCFKPVTEVFSEAELQPREIAPENHHKYTIERQSEVLIEEEEFYNEKEESYEISKKKEEKIKKKEAKPMNKNANLPKFLIRIFIKYVDRFKELYTKREFDRLVGECRKMKDWKRHDRKQHAFGLKHLKKFFQDRDQGYPEPNLNRKVITSIIESFLLEQICENSQIPQSHRVGYLVACKVYSIRCRNAILAGRIQSK